MILPGAGSLDEQTPLFFGRSINARLIHEGDDNILSGKNIRPAGCGAMADYFCVVCADSAGKPRIAFVSADTPGVQKGNLLKETGLNACQTLISLSIMFGSLGKPYSKELTPLRDSTSG